MKHFLAAICLIAVTQIACVDDDFFGLSSFARIKTIELSNQASAAVIDNNAATVMVEFPPGVDISQTEVRVLTLSSFATAEIVVGDIVNMNNDLQVTVTAEDGTMANWTIIPNIAGANPQLPNRDFEQWYMTSGGYLEPGESQENTIWGTGNPGTQLLDILTTTPYEVTDQNTAVRMETKFNGPLPAAFGTPISAATIYIGKFNTENIDPSDPRAAIDFGSPFTGRPKAFTLDYTYQPGPENQDRNQGPLPYSDQCDIYLLLEVRNQSSVKRLGTAWFRSDAAVGNFEEIEVPVVYGELDSSFPDFMKPADGSYVSADSAQFVLPTHVTFVASSSFDGDNFAGAVGSLLFIDNLELIYE